jgi:hypothetical protein
MESKAPSTPPGSFLATTAKGTEAKAPPAQGTFALAGKPTGKGTTPLVGQTPGSHPLVALTPNSKAGGGQPPIAVGIGTSILGNVPNGQAGLGTAPGISGFATALAQVRGLSLIPGQTLSGPFFQGRALSGLMGQALGFGNGIPFPGLLAKPLGSLKTAKLLGVPFQSPLTAPVLGTLQALRGPGMFQKLEHSLLNFSNLLFGNYLKGLPRTKLTPNEMMLQQLALMLAVEEKKKEKLKKREKTTKKAQVEKKDDDLLAEETNEEEEFIQHFERMMEILNRYRDGDFMIQTEE